MSTDPRLASIATAVPPHLIHREEVMAAARRLFAGRAADIERMMPIYANSGIERRHSCVPLDWYLRPHGWRERNRLYVEHALDLAAEAVRACLERAGLGPSAIDQVVTVSTTGVATPGLDALLAERLGLRPEVVRLPVFGFGCAGGVLGLSRAAALARAQPGSRVLLVVVELCGLTFRSNDQSNGNIVATALFGDGAAAVLLSGEADGPRLGAAGEHRWPGSLDVMGWRIEDDGFGVLFSRDIPSLVRRRLRPVVDAFLDRAGLDLERVALPVCHPGGAKVVAALEEAFGLRPGALALEREVLRGFGNMSAATVLFVLERALARPPRRGRWLVSGLGPGFTAGFQMIEVS